MLQKVVTHEEIIKRAHALGKLAESTLTEADANGGYGKDFRDALHETGIHRILRPKRYGGLGLSHRTMLEAVRTVSQYSVAGGWLTLFMPAHECWVAMLPPKGREEIFGSDEFVADILYPIGKVEYVEGGVRLSGRWQWGSGIEMCGWIGLGAIVDLPGELFGIEGGPQACLCTIKVSEGNIIRDWKAFGLNGSGSHSIEVNDVFVPWHRVCPLAAIKKNAIPIGGDFDPEEAVYHTPFGPAFAIGFATIALGGAQRLQRELRERLHNRQRVVLGMKEWESPVAQRNLGEVTTMVETAEALYERALQQIEHWTNQGRTSASEEEQAQVAAWRCHVGRIAAQVGFRTMELLGGAAAYRGDLVEVFARDLFMMSIHFGQAYDDHMMFYGRSQYGLSAHPLV
ncbi:MAG: acyl-CoA dehydrogenase family protein [Rugosibacter sp.]|nr:acyl-CoA dehydrogenase family protein [Rugosibacter sp.]